MGLINLGERKSVYNKERDRYEWKTIWNGLSATHTFLNTFNFKKASQSFVCMNCGEEKPKNTRYLGKRYEQICCDCSSEWIKNSKKALQEMEMLLNNSKKDLKLNKDKWRKEMILGALN